MSTVEEIIVAASRLDPTEFLHLRQKLEQLEEELWEAELTKTSKELEQANLTEEAIDQLVMRRRHEGRR